MENVLADVLRERLAERQVIAVQDPRAAAGDDRWHVAIIVDGGYNRADAEAQVKNWRDSYLRAFLAELE